MPKYEYKFVKIEGLPPEKVEDLLNEYGNLSWRACRFYNEYIILEKEL